MSYTYAVLPVSQSTFEEVTKLLRAAGYDQAFHNEGKTIDMHGIALEVDQTVPEIPKPTEFYPVFALQCGGCGGAMYVEPHTEHGRTMRCVRGGCTHFGKAFTFPRLQCSEVG